MAERSRERRSRLTLILLLGVAVFIIALAAAASSMSVVVFSLLVLVVIAGAALAHPASRDAAESARGGGYSHIVGWLVAWFLTAATAYALTASMTAVWLVTVVFLILGIILLI